MNWRTIILSFALGFAIDVALVWSYYWWNDEPYKWSGFWIWQGILIAAGLLLWLRKILGFAIWYLMFGRAAIAAEAYHKYLEFGFLAFDAKWDDLESWLSQHIPEGQPAAASELLAGLIVGRQSGVLQYFLFSSAYKKAAISYTRYLKRKGLI